MSATAVGTEAVADPTERPALELVDVHAGYGVVEILHGVSMTVPQGSVLAILGPNGAGKTTTVRTMSGLITPTRGEVLVDGVDVTGVAPDALARAGVCVIPEGRGIFHRLTVDEHVRLLAKDKASLADIQERVWHHFPKLHERRTQLVGTMSGGEQQMVALARAVAVDHQLVIIDELSMGLAPRIVEQLYQHVAALAAAGVAIVVVEQFIHEVLGLADHAVVLSQGRVLASGHPEAISPQLEALYLAHDQDH